MPLFYLHLCNGRGFVEDEDGSEFSNLSAARNGAIHGLRDALAADVRDGEINIAAFIEIEDAQHGHLCTIHCNEAIKVVTQNGRTPR